MTSGAPVLIVVEDEPTIRRFIRKSLEHEGWHVYEADTVRRGLVEAGTRKPDMAVLDLGLPDGDGMTFIRELRTWSDIPILVLSARTAEADKVAALDAGADDYLTKPFGAAELLARVRAHWRRRCRTEVGESVSQFGEIRIDLARRAVERAGQPVHLTPIEYRLLTHLIAHPDRVLTHRQLLHAVWGPAHGEQVHYVRVFMASLRKKLERDPAQPSHLLTEPGVGYRFVA